MIRIFALSAFILTQSCSQVELIPSTSEQIMSKIKSFSSQKAVLLNIWALWCVPCVEEFPMIVDLDNEYDELEIIFVSADFHEQKSEVQKFLKKQGLDSFSFLKNEKDDRFISGILPEWTGSLPFTVVYAKNSGIIVDSWEGKDSKSRFRAAIDIAIKS